MDRMNVTFGEIPNLQVMGRGLNPALWNLSSGQGSTNVLRMIDSLIRNEDILRRTINSESQNDGLTPVSEEFLTNLEEFEISEVREGEGEDLTSKECSICLESFKIGDKCIRLPCKDNHHVFHAGNDSCSGITKWFETKNTCPLCREEFPTNVNHQIHAEPEPETPAESGSILPPSLIPSIVTTLSPAQIAGIHHSNIDNIIPDTNDNHIIGEQILSTVDNYLRELSSDIIRSSLNTTDSEDSDSDLQRAIELSLSDIS
tara:strand:- start:1251 stop:2027 length:777 start_codon:yes stop_codon:yes gene_type:complete